MSTDQPRSLSALFPQGLALAVIGSVLWGTFKGASYATQGFPLLTLDGVRSAVLLGLVVGFGFLLLYGLLRRLLSARLPSWLHPWLPAALAAAPWGLWYALEVNRARGLRPSDLFSSYGLSVNLKLLVLLLMIWILVSLWLRGQEADTGNTWRWLAVPVLVPFLLWGVGNFTARPGEKERTDVLILLVDALRADHLGSYGYSRETSPAMDSLAKDGVLFEHAIAQSTFTKSSIASLFTGRNVYRHGVYWGSHQENPGHITSDLLSLEENTLAERLRERDYLTVAWVQNSHLRDFMGFGQGFVDYNDQQGSIQRIHRRSFPFFKGSGRTYPFFAYLHYIDLHDPYRPPPPYDTLFGSCGTVYDGVDLSNFGAYLKAIRDGERDLSDLEVEELRACYDGLIRLVDDEIGRLLETLKRAGLYDDMLIVLTSDHGDAFYEHGFISHSTTPYEELVRVPLIVKLPKGEYAGRVIDTQVRSVDILPTVLSLVGSERDRAKGFPGIDGCSLHPLFTGGGIEERCSTAVSEIAEEGDEPTVSVRTDRHKIIRFAGGHEELYNLETDPGELYPLEGPEIDDSAFLTLRQIAQLVVDSADRDAAEKIALDEQQIRELKALGYLVE